MAKFQKIHDSIHYNEIVKFLLEGKSSRYVSDYLRSEYNENITHATINSFKKDELNLKGRIDKKFEKKQREKIEKEILKETKENVEKSIPIDKTKNEIQARADIETAVNKGVATREVLQMIIEDAPNIWKEVCRDPEVSSDTKMKLALQATKQDLDWNKDEKPEVNIYSLREHFNNDLMKEILNERHSRTKRKYNQE